MNRKTFTAIPTVFSLIVLFYIAIYLFYYKPYDTKYSSSHSSPILDKEKVSKGYTLVTPYDIAVNDDPKSKSKIYLLDLIGKPVHTWTTNNQPLYAIVKKNGNLLVVMEPSKRSQPMPPGGNTGTIQELDWNSNVIWEYKNELMHHDMIPLENGNVLIALWEETPAEISERVQGGAAGTELEGTMWSDVLVEITPKGDIVWSWHAHEHLDTEIDIMGKNMPRFGWTFINGMSYMKQNPIDREEAYLISMRAINTVMMVRKRDGQVIWRSPKNLLSAQHDPTLLKNGNILVFDNGYDRTPNPLPSYGSRIVEINPKNNAIAWQFDGGEGVINKVKFFAPLVGGAQELENGNILITDGPKGRIFEVNRAGRIVWDLVNPYTTMTENSPSNFLYKTRRYTEKEIEWPVKMRSSFNEGSFEIYQLLRAIYPQ